MPTSAEQIHQGKLKLPTAVGPRGDLRPPAGDLRLHVDLDVCAQGECRDCQVRCSYFYHPGNNGIRSVVELLAYALVCRRCEQPHCVSACPFEALEQQKDNNNLLVRHNMRCVSCRSCSHACPYGTLYPETVPLLEHTCDFCLDRQEQPQEPLCVRSCTFGALALKKADEELPENTFLVGDDLVVHSTHWMRDKA